MGGDTGRRSDSADSTGAASNAFVVAGIALAAAIVVATVILIWVTGGVGALLVTAAATAGLTAWAGRRHRTRHATLPPWRRRHAATWGIARRVVVVGAVWNAISIAVYVVPDNGDSTSQQMAAWGRNHGLGEVIDRLEAWVYDEPPSKEPAKALALAPGISLAPATTVDEPATSTTATGPGPGPGPDDTLSPATTVVDRTPQPPAPIVPSISPALGGEGQWVAIAQAGGHDAMWATSIRPLGDTGGVVATMVVIDQTDLRAGLFNGSEEPGGRWTRGNSVPSELHPALLATMNGGFRFEHIKGGYVTEGEVVKPLRAGDATLAVGRDGRLVLGQLGRDLFDDGSWTSLRQNLILIVDGGQSQVQRGIAEGVWWGADFGREVYVNRSAVCELADGRLAYLLVGIVDAEQLAQSLINLGCIKAIQLDINGTWPSYMVYPRDPDGTLDAQLIDRRMGTNARRYLNGSTKEFFAFFDAGLVPQASVLDA